MNKLSTNLNHLLHNADISENELARRTGIAQQIINRILSGENKNPKISTLNPLANYFGVSIRQLIGDEISEDKKKLDIQFMGLKEIPIINLNSLIMCLFGFNGIFLKSFRHFYNSGLLFDKTEA